MLFAIGAGPQVVGGQQLRPLSSRGRALPKVGALIDPDTERILSLRPDSGRGLRLAERRRGALQEGRHPDLQLPHGVTDAILGTLDTITASARHRPRGAGARVVVRITTGLDRVRMRVAGLDRPRTMLVIGRQPGTLQGILRAAAAAAS
jgi:hypothetical protein